MKFLRIITVVAVVSMFFAFAAACGSRDDLSELIRANELLQEEINRLMAAMPASQLAFEDFQCEYPMFNRDIQSLLNEPIISESGMQQLGWQNLAAQSTGRDYILWRGSWSTLSDTEHYINLLVQNGWELVSMFSAGQLNGIVVVMRR